MVFPNAHCSLLSSPAWVLESQMMPCSVLGPQGDSGGKTNIMHEMSKATEREQKQRGKSSQWVSHSWEDQIIPACLGLFSSESPMAPETLSPRQIWTWLPYLQREGESGIWAFQKGEEAWGTRAKQ